MPVYRCPRCRAEDISADAHPTRVMINGRLISILVCRACYRAAELELRIAGDAADIPLQPMPIREALMLLADHYQARLAAVDDPDLLLNDDERAAAKAPIAAALREISRRLALETVRDA